MRTASESLSRLARGLILVAIFLPGGTVDLLPYAFGPSCAHECCRRTNACHRRSSSRAHERRSSGGDAPRLSARHVLETRCRELCGLLQVASGSILTPPDAVSEPAPPPPVRALAVSASVQTSEDENRVASPRGPPPHFSPRSL